MDNAIALMAQTVNSYPRVSYGRDYCETVAPPAVWWALIDSGKVEIITRRDCIGRPVESYTAGPNL